MFRVLVEKTDSVCRLVNMIYDFWSISIIFKHSKKNVHSSTSIHPPAHQSAHTPICPSLDLSIIHPSIHLTIIRQAIFQFILRTV